MNTYLMWGGLVLLVALLTFLNQKQLYSSKVKHASRELRSLAENVREGRSAPVELVKWEQAVTEMEQHPNEYNKLDAEIGLRRVFVIYLEQHYPQDPRLPGLREAAAHLKDTVWGLKLGDYGHKR
ncbi:hypothetical protein R70723_25050 [Paenibacillus sp. FSL R7-0273]|uniref:hypothetical protein n=1 Tax=Paenibacillus sp. FSL R7-0273 TaxID=1536772 RepID=UPI0004F89F18|nr:hypothetical protein [Paenibacillus sp. FSL R7-0273]AIQ48809.1 hypothetical protein R70723_25050 [Paenibacillus sp. FSL R7-0273]OMF93855.1 hypothetical protein BK144_09575 [Paenibacillus sp. FSL R7-0273]